MDKKKQRRSRNAVRAERFAEAVRYGWGKTGVIPRHRSKVRVGRIEDLPPDHPARQT